MSWIQTYTGKKLYPIEPSVSDIDIMDIAHALSMICRFTGHCSQFYSVAQHSVLVARMCKKNKLAALFHDAHEAYLCDMASPVKPYFKLLMDSVVERLQNVIHKKFNIVLTDDEKREIHEVDIRMLLTEKDRLFNDRLNWGIDNKPYEDDYLSTMLECCWPQWVARDQFLSFYSEMIS